MARENYSHRKRELFLLDASDLRSSTHRYAASSQEQPPSRLLTAPVT